VRAFEAFPDLALQVAVSNDGSRLAGGDWMGDLRVWLTADGKSVGNLTLNPPTIAERLEAARKHLEACSQKLAQLKASSDAARAAADRSGAELAAVKETVALSLQKRKAALEEARSSRDAAGKAGASLNKALAGGETSAGEHSRALEASVLEWVEAQREAEKALAAAARARDAVKALEPKVRDAEKKAASGQTSLEEASASLASARAAVEKWTLAENLDAAKKAVAVHTREVEQLREAARISRESSEKLSGELQEAEKAAAGARSAHQSATSNSTRLKKEAEKTSGELSAALARLTGLEEALKKEGSGIPPELSAAQKDASDLARAVKEQTAAWLAAREALSKTGADLASAEEQVKKLEPRVKAAGEKAAADQQAAEKASSALAGAKSELEKIIKALTGGKSK
jgi:chromosome segregation ATPase